MTDVPEFLRAMVRRDRAGADAAPLVTEVRTEGSVIFKAQPNEDLVEELPDAAVWEWTFGVPEARIKQLIEWLQENEEEIIDRMKAVLSPGGEEGRLIRYRGTFITVTADRGWYEVRTRWGYTGASPIVQWAALLDDAEFFRRFLYLRGLWGADPTAKDQVHCLLQFYEYPTNFTGYGTPAEKAAIAKILAATALARPEPV